MNMWIAVNVKMDRAMVRRIDEQRLVGGVVVTRSELVRKAVELWLESLPPDEPWGLPTEVSDE